MGAVRRGQANGDLGLDEMLKRIDVYSRLAFGGQCVSAMAMIGAPLLFITCSIVPWVIWDDNRPEALLVWLGGWAVAAGAMVGAIALAVFCWRWSGDWITEWYGYAVGFAIAGAADAALAYMLTSTPIPVPVSFAIALGAAFTVGCLVAGHLGGARVLQRERSQRARR